MKNNQMCFLSMNQSDNKSKVLCQILAEMSYHEKIAGQNVLGRNVRLPSGMTCLELRTNIVSPFKYYLSALFICMHTVKLF